MYTRGGYGILSYIVFLDFKIYNVLLHKFVANW
jgi:hypothetical protein